jgi:hypothetical protein
MTQSFQETRQEELEIVEKMLQEKAEEDAKLQQQEVEEADQLRNSTAAVDTTVPSNEMGFGDRTTLQSLLVGMNHECNHSRTPS